MGLVSAAAVLAFARPDLVTLEERTAVEALCEVEELERVALPLLLELERVDTEELLLARVALPEELLELERVALELLLERVALLEELLLERTALPLPEELLLERVELEDELERVALELLPELLRVS